MEFIIQQFNRKITIPIIQRAYTQGGRGGDPKIEFKGEKFLTRLIEALKGNPIIIDFVYGSNEKQSFSFGRTTAINNIISVALVYLTKRK